jgi:uncharacterized membrane protein (DUF2068 family)
MICPEICSFLWLNAIEKDSFWHLMDWFDSWFSTCSIFLKINVLNFLFQSVIFTLTNFNIYLEQISKSEL